MIGRGRPRGLARRGLPQALLFRFLFTLAALLINLALLGSMGDGLAHRRPWLGGGLRRRTMDGGFHIGRSGMRWVACCLDPREGRLPALQMLGQRSGYRQLLYAVVLRAIGAALAGPRVGWGKLERSGNVMTPRAPDIADVSPCRTRPDPITRVLPKAA